MPHSSGGGSHGGGSHGGHSSGSFHSSHGSYSATTRHVYSHRTPGCYTYMYFRKGQPKYLYTDYDVIENKENIKKGTRIFGIATAVCLVVNIFLFLIACMPASKLSTNYDTKIITQIYNASEQDTKYLYDELSLFQNKTGITPAIIFVNNEDWEGYYKKLENYAYYLYVNSFKDEKHWLIVYSEPKVPDSSFNDWYWEGMQGNDTDAILNDYMVNKFSISLQKYLTQNTQYNKVQAITKAFADMNPQIREFNLQSSDLDGAIMMSFITVFCLTIFLISFIEYLKVKNKNFENLTFLSTIKERKCEYCGGLYIVGQHLSCPHCGATISLSTPSSIQFDVGANHSKEYLDAVQRLNSNNSIKQSNDSLEEARKRNIF